MGKKLAKIMVLVLITNTIFNVTQVKAQDDNGKKYVYVDGVEYCVYVDEDFNTIVKAVGEDAELILDKELNGTISIQDGKESGTYDIEVSELDVEQEEMDITVYKEDIVFENYDDIEEIIPDEYSGQAAIAVAGGTIFVGGLISALVYALVTVTVAGVVCYAVDAIVKQVKQNQQYYYKAYLKLGTVVINPYAITSTEAKNRIKNGDNTYTYTATLARSIVVATGLGVVGPENHYKWYSLGSFFNHYHTANRNGAHSFYGLPV